jgi:hypothetical protein
MKFRHEIKAVLSPIRAKFLADDVSRICHLDEHCSDGKPYFVRSLYFESRDLLCYRLKDEGLEEKFKLRLRRYNDEKFHFLEAKIKRGLKNSKERVVLDTVGAREVSRRHFHVLRDFSPDVDSILSYFTRYNLMPKVLVQYRRLAYLKKHKDDMIRITFDSHLTSSLDTKTYFRKMSTGFPLTRQVIMELKFKNSLPFWLSRLLEKHHVAIATCGKYNAVLDGHEV